MPLSFFFVVIKERRIFFPLWSVKGICSGFLNLLGYEMVCNVWIPWIHSVRIFGGLFRFLKKFITSRNDRFFNGRLQILVFYDYFYYLPTKMCILYTQENIHRISILMRNFCSTLILFQKVSTKRRLYKFPSFVAKSSKKKLIENRWRCFPRFIMSLQCCSCFFALFHHLEDSIMYFGRSYRFSPLFTNDITRIQLKQFKILLNETQQLFRRNF